LLIASKHRPGNQPVVDPTVADEEERHGVSGFERGDNRARRGRWSTRTGTGSGKRRRRGPGFEFGFHSRDSGGGRNRFATFGFFFRAAAHFPEQEDRGDDEQDADKDDLGDGVVVQLLAHTLTY
jgi:hypothetical protein